MYNRDSEPDSQSIELTVRAVFSLNVFMSLDFCKTVDCGRFRVHNIGPREPFHCDSCENEIITDAPILPETSGRDSALELTSVADS